MHTPTRQLRARHILIMALILMGLVFRTSGLFRGLESGYIFHPDAPKQVSALQNFLENRYIWHVGNLFYDGYPFGLNHVDEWILRPVLAIHKLVLEHFFPDAHIEPPDRLALFYWTRLLRVLYGLAAMILTYFAARHLMERRGGALAALLLASIAPLSIVVTHSSTGDIGTDLFTLCAVLCLCIYAQHGGRLWLTLIGISAGLSFAAKYHGIMAILPAMLFIVICPPGTHPVRTRLTSFLTLTAACVVGAVAGTPALLLNRHRAWHDIWANFEFIRNYNMTADYLAKTPWEKLTHALTVNGVLVVSSLGTVLVLLAISGMIISIRTLLTYRRQSTASTGERRQIALEIAICVFPFLALLAALAGKPSVQPFHFSFLQAPVILAATVFLHRLWIRPGAVWKSVASLLFLLAVMEMGRGALREDFFWRRTDTLYWCTQVPWQILKDSPHPDNEPAGDVKCLYLEPGGLAIFRNAKHSMPFPHADLWNQYHIAPVPDIPLNADPDWIFANGPVFPRNDRMIRVQGGSETDRHVVFHAPPGRVGIGVRSGSWPSFVTIDLGGDQKTLTLAPNSQSVLFFTPRQWRRSPGIPSFPSGSYLVPLRIASRCGTITASLLTQPDESHCFSLFGGEITNRIQLATRDLAPAELVDEVRHMRFLEGNENAAVDPSLENGFRFPKAGFTLPAGSYLLRCEIRCPTPSAKITVKLDDRNRSSELTVLQESHTLTEGLNVVTTRFSKAFAPYEVQIQLNCSEGRCRLESWSLVPDTGLIRADLESWMQGGAQPEWAKRSSGVILGELSPQDPPLTFGDRIRLTHLMFPATISNGQPVPVFCKFELTAPPFDNFQDYVVFFHLLNDAGHTVHQFHIALWEAVALGSLGRPAHCAAPSGIAPGRYRLEVGLYNARTFKRVPLRGPGLEAEELKHKCHIFGVTELGKT